MVHTSVVLRVGLVVLLVGHHYHIHKDDLQGFDRLYQVSDTLNPASHEFWEMAILLSLFVI